MHFSTVYNLFASLHAGVSVDSALHFLARASIFFTTFDSCHINVSWRK